MRPRIEGCHMINVSGLNHLPGLIISIMILPAKILAPNKKKPKSKLGEEKSAGDAR